VLNTEPFVSGSPHPQEGEPSTVSERNRESHSEDRHGRAVTLGALGLVWLCAVLLSARGITQESAVSLDGDMPRYLMNGVFFLDGLHDLPLTAPLDYTRHYFARYPALSLGHHPLVPAVAQVPFHWLFGVSVFGGRATIVAFLLVGVTAFFYLILNIYGLRAAVLSSLLLVTSPSVVRLSQAVLSEIPTLSLITLSAYLLHRYCATGEKRDMVGFIFASALSVYSKHFAVFMLPVYLAYFAYAKGVRRLFARDVLWSVVSVAVLILPLVPITLKLSQFNLNVLSEWAPEETAGRFFLANYLPFFNEFIQTYTTVPVALIALLGLAWAVVVHDRRVVFFATWIVLYCLQLITLGWGEPRFAIYVLPGICLLAASVASLPTSARWRTALASVVVAAIGYQTIVTARVEPAGASGYEEAAKFVADHPKGETVLFNGIVDSGYFVFFARKHDPDRQMIVLRADKILTTSQLMEPNAEDRIHTPEDVKTILHDYGVGYVVAEDTEYPAGPLRWLDEKTHTDQFRLVKRIPIESTDRRLREMTLSIYENQHYTPARESTVLDMNIPLMGDSIVVRLSDLLSTNKDRR
jgi:hypothetical protein